MQSRLRYVFNAMSRRKKMLEGNYWSAGAAGKKGHELHLFCLGSCALLDCNTKVSQTGMFSVPF